MRKYTKDQFFDKMEWEGGAEAMAGYAGQVEITDDEDLNEVWNALVPLLLDIGDIYSDWEMTREWEEPNDE